MKRLKPVQKVLLCLITVILVLLLAELIFRHRSWQNSWATFWYNHYKIQAAAKIWEKLAQRDDLDPIPKANAAKAHYKQGDYQGAESLLDSALAASKNKAHIHYDQGNSQYRQEELDKALESFKAAMLADPDDQDAKSNYELVLNRKGYKKPQKEDYEDEQQDKEQKQNDYDNTLNALDEQESLDRQKQQHQPQIPRERWW